MGIPYSRQINAAFEEVTPLVAAGYKILRTTRDVAILLATIQILTVFLLTAILLALIALLYSVNPALEVCRLSMWMCVFLGSAKEGERREQMEVPCRVKRERLTRIAREGLLGNASVEVHCAHNSVGHCEE